MNAIDDTTYILNTTLLRNKIWCTLTASRNLNANSNSSPLSAYNAMQPHFRTTASQSSPLPLNLAHTVYSCNKRTRHSNTTMYTSFAIKKVAWEDDITSRHFHSTEQILHGESNSSSASQIFSHCIKPEGSLPCSQQPATDPCPEISVQFTCHQHLHVETPWKKLGHYSQSPGPCAPEMGSGSVNKWTAIFRRGS